MKVEVVGGGEELLEDLETVGTVATEAGGRRGGT